MSFETSIERLEEIVERLDGDELTLDDALRLFEQGVEQLRTATAELARAEAQVRQLVEQANGELGLADFGA